MDTGAEFEVPTFRIAAPTSRCGKAGRCRTTSSCAPRTDTTRSQGLSVRYSIATAHSSTVRMRWRTSPGRARLHVPDGNEDFQDIAAGHLRDRHPADARKGVAPQARHTVVGLPLIAPAGPLLLHHPLGGFCEGGHIPCASSLGQGIPTFAGQLAVGARLFVGLGEGHQRHAAESEIAAAAANDEALDPTPGSARLDVEVQSVAVAVFARWSGAHESGGKRLVGVAALRLGLPGRKGRNSYITNYTLIYGMSWISMDVRGGRNGVRTSLN